uniref:RF_PROK_I domain-containing protein n=1 Tax=Hydatigena taeniaeformis TaxID=6205 RepID=A0A0R3X4G5_HYDTA
LVQKLLSITRAQVHNAASLHAFTGRWNDKEALSIVLNESDLEETFICGWGPGGQAINKTANCVRLKHLPTGICIKCQASDLDLHANRIIARKRLEERLDEYFNGDSSAGAVRRKEAQKKENNRYSRAKRRLEMKAAFKAKCPEDRRSSD